MAAEPIAIPRRMRCAIYTRKSTDEGLDQAFNSLDAQREASEAYIKSQAPEGWLTLPHRYDDGGFTGANMERPALRKLVQDIEAGHIDCVVVYKVDRLSRSLFDFARMMSLFEKQGVSLVSVTQQFATSTSVGRLTLHILLSFADFERSLIRERTRDKKAAARSKGQWIGGYVPLGYDLDARGGRLIVNETEAAQVRAMFEVFVENRALEPTLHEIAARGWTTKSWTTRANTVHAGRPFTEGSLRRLLTNELYAGMVAYKGQVYRGEHEPIISKRLWRRVNQLIGVLPKAAKTRVSRAKALLAGLLYCAGCAKAMAHTWTVRRERRYEYYVCHTRTGDCPRPSLPAPAIESSVVDQIVKTLDNARNDGEAAIARRLRQRFGADWKALDADELRGLMHDCVERVSYDGASGRVSIEWKPTGKAHG